MTPPLIGVHHGDYIISTGPSRVDVQAARQFLTNEGYWSKGRSAEVVATADLKRQLLATHDAHTLYESFGFVPLDAPTKWMERRTR